MPDNYISHNPHFVISALSPTGTLLGWYVIMELPMKNRPIIYAKRR